MRETIKTILRRIIPKKWYLQIAFKLKFGKWINFSFPLSMNEKIQWSKIYDYKDIHKVIADKYAVRQYVKDMVGEKYLIPLVGVFCGHNDFNYSTLPNSFVAKSAHGSGQVIIVRDKSEISESYLRNKFKKWMGMNFYWISMEPQYKHIKPKIIIEKLINDSDGRIPRDYKLHCFSGKVEMIQVDIDRFGDHRRNFYNTDWELLPFNWSAVDRRKKTLYPNGQMVLRPEQLDEMIVVAEKLSKMLNYIRVDLYNTNKKVYFGELTIHHGGGFEHFIPPEFDLFYGGKMITD